MEEEVKSEISPQDKLLAVECIYTVLLPYTKEGRSEIIGAVASLLGATQIDKRWKKEVTNA